MITKLNLKPARKEQRCIELMYGTMRKIVEVYGVTVHSLAVEGFSIDVECINAEKGVLTHRPNPNIKALKKQCCTFRRLTFTEEATRSDIMPVHVILKFIWKHFKGVVTCTLTLMLPNDNRVLIAMLFNICIFLKK